MLLGDRSLADDHALANEQLLADDETLLEEWNRDGSVVERLVENRDGAWFAIADAAGTGPTAAGLGAAALGALRAARRSGHDLEEALQAMHETVRRLDNPDFYVTALVARWRAATSTFTWVNCGHPHAFLVDVDGTVSELEGPVHEPLGAGVKRRPSAG
jgi:hypothetical protein